MGALSTSIRALLIDALFEQKGDTAAAALNLNIGRTTLYRRLTDMNIERIEYVGSQATEMYRLRHAASRLPVMSPEAAREIVLNVNAARYYHVIRSFVTPEHAVITRFLSLIDAMAEARRAHKVDPEVILAYGDTQWHVCGLGWIEVGKSLTDERQEARVATCATAA